MTALVTQLEALRQLRLNATTTSPDEIADVMFKADQASAIVVDYLKRPFAEVGPVPDPLTPSPYAPTASPAGVMPAAPYTPPPWDATTTPVLVKGVILVLLTSLYDGRTPDDALLSENMMAVLHRYRDPALA